MRNAFNNHDLSANDIDGLKELNNRLRTIEEFIFDFMQSNDKVLKEEITKGLIVDYDYEFSIYYRLKDSDPDYDQLNDGIICMRKIGCLFGKATPIEIFNNNFCESAFNGTPLSDFAHCYLFHDLYDHNFGEDEPSLSFADCLRVGSISVDANICKEYLF